MTDHPATNDNRVLIVGDGPTGLGAALILAKTGFDVHVFGTNSTPVHKAHLFNYLGDDDTSGPHFVEKSRKHALRFGAKLHEARVERVEAGESFRLHAADGVHEGKFLVLATGFAASLAGGLGLEVGEDGVRVDHNGRTSHSRVYAGGAATRGAKSQVATSVGDGAAIAVDILSLARGKPSHDYDVVRAIPRAGSPA